jgi:hypothetical protein
VDATAPIRYGQGECVFAKDKQLFAPYGAFAQGLCDGAWLLELPGPALHGSEKETLTLGQDRNAVFAYDMKHAPAWSRDDSSDSQNPEFDAFIESLLSRLQEFEELHQGFLKYCDIKQKTMRNYGHTHVKWGDILPLLNSDDDKAMRGLIVKHAQRMQPYLRTIEQGPKRVLQRIHQDARLDRIQEQDAYCLLDYSRRPGRTAPEKAGSRQRLLSVQRQESHNTLENRVVLDFCRRSIHACRNYLNEHRGFTAMTSDRYKAVEQYSRFLLAYVKGVVWIDVKPMTEPCRTPNYVLSQNPMYVEIWKGYLELLQHADLRERIWRWPRRAWADLVRALISSSLHKLFASWHDVFRLADRPVSVTKNLALMRLFAKATYPGGWRIESSDAGCLHVVDREAIGTFFADALNIEQCNADAYLVWLPDDTKLQARLIPIWAMVGDMEDRKKIWIESLSSTISTFRLLSHVRISGAMIVLADWRNGSACEYHEKDGLPVWLNRIHCGGANSLDTETVAAMLTEPIRRLTE